MPGHVPVDFLGSTHCEHLYLVGDIVHGENIELTPYWHPTHGAVLAEILAFAASGTRMTYIPGNDAVQRRRCAGQPFAGVEVALHATHLGADGRR